MRGHPAVSQGRASSSVPPPSVRLNGLTSRRQEVIRPALENPRDYVLLSIRSLAERLGTDPATVVRIVRAMGFSDYKAFKSHLHELALAHVTALDSLQSGLTPEASIDQHMRSSLQQDSKNLSALRHTLDMKGITGAAKRIHGARQVLLMGGDLAASLVSYLEYQMTILHLNVRTATTTGRTIHVARSLTPKDVVVAISFRRGLRQTVEGLQQAHQNGAYCIGITDTYISPVARHSDEFFLTSIETPSFGASYTAPVALLNVLLLACANVQRDRTLEVLRRADEEQRSGYRWYTE